MPRKEHHVVPNPDGGWDVKREMSINQGTELIPHRKDGVIQRPDSHGNDPCPPRDRQ